MAVETLQFRSSLPKAAMLALLLTTQHAPAAVAKVHAIAAGPEALAAVRQAIAKSAPGDFIRLAAGRFDFAETIKVDAPGVSIEGAGQQQTILSFGSKPSVADVDANGGFWVAANRLTLQGFSIVDAPGPAIVGKGLEELTIRDIAVGQSLGRRPMVSMMGLRIFASQHVLIERVTLRDSSVSGLQISTSEHVVVRHSRFENNSVGIEIENDYHADVHDNVVTGNATGIMFLDMPSYPHTGSHAIRAFRNQVVNNDASTTAPSFAASARPGTGVLIMGGVSDVHLFDNNIADNGLASVLIVALPWTIDNPNYNAVANDVVIRNNTFGRTGYAPLDSLAALSAAGTPLADIVWDGATRFVAAEQVKKSPPLRLTLKDNRRADGQPVSYLSIGQTIANGGTLIAEPSRALPEPARQAEPQSVKLPQDRGTAAR
jgi:parallel beta-helix repeat protein